MRVYIEHIQVLGNSHGINGCRLKDCSLCNQIDLSDNLLTGSDPSKAHTGREYFGECAEVHNQLLRIHTLERRKELTLKAEVAIRIIFNRRNLILVDDFHELFAAFQRPGASAGILKIRNNIDELNILSRSENPIQFLHDHTVFICRDFHKLGLVLPEGIDGAQIARAFQYNNITWIKEELSDKVQSLLAASSQDDLRRIDGNIVFLKHTLGNLLSQRSPAVGRTILQCNRTGFIQDCIIGCFDVRNREQFRCRKTACKGDDVRLGCDRKKLTNI